MTKIKEMIYEYLDGEYPITSKAASKYSTLKDHIIKLPFEYFDFRMEVIIEPSGRTYPKGTSEIMIDVEVAETFGVKIDKYFWDWIEDRIGEDTVFRLDFKDHTKLYQFRMPCTRFQIEKHNIRRQYGV